jgi:formamidopyrimidine-DNA glycosylase
MPELAEVETIKRGLEPHIIGKKIIQVNKYRNNLRYLIPENFIEICSNQTVSAIARRAKYLLLQLENDYSIIIHLGMSGRFVLTKAQELKKHDHVVFEFEDSYILTLNDPRRFGLVDVVATSEINIHKHFVKLGPEPLLDKFDATYLYSITSKRNVPIKQLIMDSHIVVGVGNIYASESLYMAGIDPRRLAKELKLEEVKRLVIAIKEVLEKAIRAGGSTLKDFVSAQGETGYFQNNFTVYGRASKPCLSCSSLIQKIIQSGRASFFCENCQR